MERLGWDHWRRGEIVAPGWVSGIGCVSRHNKSDRGGNRRAKKDLTGASSSREGVGMTPEDRHEQARRLAEQYRRGSRRDRTTMLDTFCATTGLNRKYAIGLLREPPEKKRRRARKRGRPAKYGVEVIKVLEMIWESADYPWSVRLKAMVPLWLPFVKQRMAVSTATERRSKRSARGRLIAR